MPELRNTPLSLELPVLNENYVRRENIQFPLGLSQDSVKRRGLKIKL
jgi:hypothetical protein